MYDLKELVEYLYIEEYEDGYLFYRTFDDKVAEMIMIKIYDKAYDLLAECEDLCEEDNEFYKSLVLDCYPAIEDLPNFSSEQNFFYLLDNLRNKLNEIMELLSPNHDDFSNELSDKLYDIYLLCDFY